MYEKQLRAKNFHLTKIPVKFVDFRENDDAKWFPTLHCITSFLRFPWMRTFDGRFAVVWRTLGAVHVHTRIYRRTRGKVSSGKGRRNVIRHGNYPLANHS